MEKKKKEKPPRPYALLQNTGFMLRHAWNNDKKALPDIFLLMLLPVGIALAGIYLPKTAVMLIMEGAAPLRLALGVLWLLLALAVLEGILEYVSEMAGMRQSFLRLAFGRLILQKETETDYPNLEKKAYTDAKRKAQDAMQTQDAAMQAFYSGLANFGASVLGFAVYFALLARVHWLVLLLSALSSAAGMLLRRQADRWRHKNDAEPAGYRKRLWYIGEIGRDFAKAKDIRLFAMRPWLEEVYETNRRLWLSFQSRVQKKYLWADGADALAAFLREGVAYIFLIGAVLAGRMAADAFVLLFAAVGGFSGYISGILKDYTALSAHSLEICRVRELIDFPDAFVREGGKPIPSLPGQPAAFTLQNVSYRYEGAVDFALQNVSLSIRPGEKLAVVGLNGAGKTTLIKLLCGLYDPTEGAVLFNGTDIRAFDRRQYYTLFTAVFQEWNLLPLSVAENVAQSLPGAVDKKRLAECLALADLKEKIDSLPNGAETLLLKSVNEDAVEFSGGETQKLMLARALYKDAPVLILDEPTAALDPIAESRLYQRYGELAKGKTAVYISHRLASTRFCDRIIYLENQTIAEEGTHGELMAAGGAYAALFALQSKYYKEEAVV